MQPYFFPYIGYFQLIRAVDKFVLFDDVNYMKKGWVNRNYILGKPEKQRLTLELVGASQNRKINEIRIGDNGEKLLKTIRHTYAKAPEFQSIFPMLEEILCSKEQMLKIFLKHSLVTVCSKLQLPFDVIFSSELDNDKSLCGQEKIIDICQLLNANEYVNLPGGVDLYAPEKFEQKGIKLTFIQPQLRPYNQQNGKFMPGLSIIDPLMFVPSMEIISSMLD
jgi:hypothetical protein